MGTFRPEDRSKRDDQRLRNRKIRSCAEPAFPPACPAPARACST